jgi:hypothetical protein
LTSFLFFLQIVRSRYNFRDHIMRAHGINGRGLVETHGTLLEDMS